MYRWWIMLFFLACTAAAVERESSTHPFTLTGNFIQGGLVVGRTVPGTQVFQDGQALRVSGNGEFLLGFTRDAPATSQLKLRLPGGELIEQTLQVATREYRIQRIDGLPPGKVTPRSAEDLARIRRDTAAVKKARARDDDRQDFLPGFDWPVTGPILRSPVRRSC